MSSGEEYLCDYDWILRGKEIGVDDRFQHTGTYTQENADNDKSFMDEIENSGCGMFLVIQTRTASLQSNV